MLKFISSALTLILLLSCTNESVNKSCSGEIDLEQMVFPQKWKLVKMTGSMMGSATTGADMTWQEYIALNQDGTFIKHREQDDQSQEVTGTYTYSKASDNSGLELTLTFPSSSNLVGSCYSQTEEKYSLTSRCTLIGTWQHCDGPGLDYKLF